MKQILDSIPTLETPFHSWKASFPQLESFFPTVGKLLSHGWKASFIQLAIPLPQLRSSLPTFAIGNLPSYSYWASSHSWKILFPQFGSILPTVGTWKAPFSVRRSLPTGKLPFHWAASFPLGSSHAFEKPPSKWEINLYW